MLNPTFVMWDILYPFYTYASLFIVILILWRVKKRHCGLKLEPTKSICQRHRRVRQRTRDMASRAMKSSRKEAKKPWQLLSVMKSHNWLPEEGRVRRLLCADPCCPTCDDVALEIQQLFTSEDSLVAPTSVRATQRSSRTEILPPSTVSLEQTLELHCQHSREILMASGTSTLSQFTDQDSLTLTTSPSSGQDYWTAPLDLGQECPLPNVPRDLRTMSSLQTEECTDPATQPHPMVLCNDAVLPSDLPFLSSDVLRLLEVHMKKWVHFLRWGFPKRVEESLSQLRQDPPLSCQPENSQLVPLVTDAISNACAETIGTIFWDTGDSHMGSQPPQAMWDSEWSRRNSEQSHPSPPCQKTPRSEPLALPTSALKVLNNISSQSGGQAEDAGTRGKPNQLFYGLPRLHSESLLITFKDSQGAPKNRSISQPASKVPLLFNKPSFLPLLPNNPPHLATPPSPPTHTWVSPPDLQQIQNNFPFLTLGEYEALEWHLLRRQLQLRWDLPAASQSHMPSESRATNQSPETFWPPVSVLPREQLWFPDHAWRLLELHFQKKLIYHHWGLPQMIKQSIQLLLPPTDQQPRHWNSTALDTLTVPPPEGPEADGVSDPMPHWLTQTKAMLQSHINSKCWQIHGGTVPAPVCLSWDSRVPENLAVIPFPCVEDPDPDPRPTAVPEVPTDLDQQFSSGAVLGHPWLSGSPAEGATEEQETTLGQGSGLPALTHMTDSKAMVPVITNPSEITEMIPEPGNIKPEPVTELITSEEPREASHWSGLEEDETCEDSAHGVLTSRLQEEHMGTGADIPHSLMTTILSKLNLHLEKKILEMRLGIPIKARESRDLMTAISENISTQEARESPTDQGKASLPESSIPLDIECSIPPNTERSLPPNIPRAADPEWVRYKEQLASELKAIQQTQKQASSNSGSAPWGDKISPPSEEATNVQVLRVHLETRVDSPSLEETWYSGSQSPEKSKASAQVPTQTEKKPHPRALKPAGDHGEGDAGLGVPLTTESRHPGEDQRPAGTPLSRSPRDPWRRSHSFNLAASCLQGLPHVHQLKPPEPPPGVRRGKESEKSDLQLGSQTKLKCMTKPARSPATAQPVVARAPECHPLLRPLMEGKPLQGRTWQGESLQGQVASAHTHQSPGPPASGLRSKMTHFLHSINPKTKGKANKESMFCPAENVTKTKKIPEKRPALTQGPVGPGRGQTEDSATGDSNPQSPPAEKHMGPTFWDEPRVPDNQLRYRSHQLSCAPVLSHARHCPRHCPRAAHTIQARSPPKAPTLGSERNTASLKGTRHVH